MSLYLSNRLEAVHSDAVVLSGLCDLAEQICHKHPDLDISAILTAMSGLSNRIANRLDGANLRKVDAA